MSTNKNTIINNKACFHCGDDCPNDSVFIGENHFCCNGCKSVFEILNEHDLCTYYSLNSTPGIGQKNEIRKDKFQFLDNKDIQKKLIQFTNGKQTQLTLYLPQIHCSSCLWLLENIHLLNAGIQNANVNFSKKEIFIVFEEEKTTLREVVETLTKIGYEPHLSLNDVSTRQSNKTDRTRWYKIGLAGFCFGNIMMMSFADYLSFSNEVEPKIQLYFKGLSILLALPVLFYSASEFFVSAWNGIKNKYLNIDLPVALAIVITFVRSIYEISSRAGTGYLDSMSGIVFFMLIGRWLQSRTYQTISFDRDYKSFFPIALNVIKEGVITPTEISKVKINDIIQIHSNEIIPVDAILSKGGANIDYSFVSGESLPVQIKIGEMIYAGGKQLEGLLELIVVKEVSQSYLTNLWNNPIFNKKDSIKKSSYDTIGKYFTYVVLMLGLVAGIYWGFQGETKLMWNAITTVLIVACPCALLLSQNYTNGNILRIFGLNKFYLRSPEIIEKLSKINHIVLDKTGTLTQADSNSVRYTGKVLTEEVKSYISSLVKQSSHPASKLVAHFLNIINSEDITNFKETEGQGIEGWIHEHHIKLGSSKFIGGEYFANVEGSKVVFQMDDEILGEFLITNKYRFGVTKLVQSLKQEYTLSLISGDNDTELRNVVDLLGKDSEVLFNQSPLEKLNYIKQLQSNHELRVMMVGDGLNDAGALKQSSIGLAVTDSSNNFTPSSDCIIEASKLTRLDTFLKFAKEGRKIILFSFTISAMYNVIGLYFAIQGVLSPVIAAILMPCSSITIILLTYGLTELAAYRFNLKEEITN